MADLKHVIIGAVIGSIIVKIVTDPWAKKQREEEQKILDETREMTSHWIDDMNKELIGNRFERFDTKEES